MNKYTLILFLLFLFPSLSYSAFTYEFVQAGPYGGYPSNGGSCSGTYESESEFISCLSSGSVYMFDPPRYATSYGGKTLESGDTYRFNFTFTPRALSFFLFTVSEVQDCSNKEGLTLLYFSDEPVQGNTISIDGCEAETRGISVTHYDGRSSIRVDFTGNPDSSSDPPPLPIPDVVDYEEFEPSTESVEVMPTTTVTDTQGNQVQTNETIFTTSTGRKVSVVKNADGTISYSDYTGTTQVETNTTVTSTQPDGAKTVTETKVTSVSAGGSSTEIFTSSGSSQSISTVPAVTTTTTTQTVTNYDVFGNLTGSQTTSSTGSGGTGGNSGGDTGGSVGLGDGVGDCDPLNDSCGDGGGLSGVGDPVSWWDSKYPDGFGQEYNDFINEQQNGPAGQFLGGFIFPSGGSLPSWQFNINMGNNMNFGTFTLSVDATLLSIIRAIMIFTAFIMARRLIFGG